MLFGIKYSSADLFVVVWESAHDEIIKALFLLFDYTVQPFN